MKIDILNFTPALLLQWTPGIDVNHDHSPHMIAIISNVDCQQLRFAQQSRFCCDDHNFCSCFSICLCETAEPFCGTQK